MHMRRKEVLRVQKLEKAQYKILLAQEQERAAEAALKAEEEAKRLALEARHRSKSRFAAAAKKQRASGPIVASAGSPQQGVPNHAATGFPKEGSFIDAASHAMKTADGSTHAAPVLTLTDPNATVDKDAIDPALILKAFSTGLIAGHSTTQAMHTFVENRYGSVYGGFYGEYCCIQDNRVHSFAAVRFRFMLRCLRNRRKKALNGALAKSFFYTLSHLHNTPEERNHNRIIQYLQVSVRNHGVQQTLRHTHASSNDDSNACAGKPAIGRMLLSSFRRTKLTLAAPQELPSGALTTTTSGDDTSTSADTHTEDSSASVLSPISSPKRASHIVHVKSPHTPDHRLTPTHFGPDSPVRGHDSPPFKAISDAKNSPGQARTSPSKEVKLEASTMSQKNTNSFPTFSVESLPNGFVTHSYRPRTFAELVLLILDMKKAVYKTPSLIDDSIAPPVVKATRPTKMGVQTLASALAKGHNGHKRKDSAHQSSPTTHRDSQHAPAHHTAAPTQAKLSIHKPPPLVRMDSNRSTGSTGRESRPTLVRERSGKSPFSETSDIVESKPPLTSMRSFKGAPLEPTAEVVEMTPTQPKEPKPPMVSKRSFKSAHVPAPEPNVVIPVAQVAVKAPPHKYINQDDLEANKEHSTDVSDVIAEPKLIETTSSDSAVEEVNNKVPEGANIPAQLRANSRVLRPSFTINTPYLAPTPYPSSPPGRYNATLLENELLGPETVKSAPVNTTYPHNNTTTTPKQEHPSSDKYIENAVKEAVQRFEVPTSIPPSEILAAARLSVRQASTVDAANGTSEATPPINRSVVSSRESIRTPMSTAFGGFGSFKSNSFVTRNLPSVGSAADLPSNNNS